MLDKHLFYSDNFTIISSKLTSSPQGSLPDSSLGQSLLSTGSEALTPSPHCMWLRCSPRCCLQQPEECVVQASPCPALLNLLWLPMAAGESSVGPGSGLVRASLPSACPLDTCALCVLFSKLPGSSQPLCSRGDPPRRPQPIGWVWNHHLLSYSCLFCICLSPLPSMSPGSDCIFTWALRKHEAQWVSVP